MPDQRDIPEQTPTSERGIEQPQAISLEVAATIAGEVRDLIPGRRGAIGLGTATSPASCRHGEHRRESAPHQSRRNGPRHVSRHCRLDAPADESRRGGKGRGASRRWRSLLCNRPSESATGLGELAQSSHPAHPRSGQSIGTSTTGRGHLLAHAPHGWGTHGQRVPHGPSPRPSRDGS